MGHPYSTADDVKQAFGGEARFIQATDWDGDRAADTAAIATAIEQADSEIDSYVNKQYFTPLASVPTTIRDVSARIAKFRMLSPRGMIDQVVKDEHDADVKWLEGVRDGLNVLGVDPVPPPSTMRRDASSDRPTWKDVSRYKLRGFS